MLRRGVPTIPPRHVEDLVPVARSSVVQESMAGLRDRRGRGAAEYEVTVIRERCLGPLGES